MNYLRYLFISVILVGSYARATVPTETKSVSYVCNGTTTFAYTFKILASTDLVVTSTTPAGSVSTFVLNTDYSVTGVGNAAGGTVVLVSGSRCTAGNTLALTRRVDLTQKTSFRTQGSFNPGTHENTFDKLAMGVQQVDQAVTVATSTHSADKIIQAARDSAQDSALSSEAAVRAVQDALIRHDLSGNPGTILDDWTVLATSAGASATLANRFGHVINVKDDWGAVGNWNLTTGADDTQAFLDAAEAANKAAIIPGSSHGKGSTIFVPRGSYRIRQELALGEGVCLIGTGRRSSVLVIDHADATADAVSWKFATQYGRGGCLRDITIYVVQPDRARDVLSLVNWGPFNVENVDLLGGGRYGLYAPDGIDLTFRDVNINTNVAAGAWIGDTIGSIPTTYTFDKVYFTNTTDGPGLDVQSGLGITCVGCIFESNGGNTPSAGHAVRVQSGHVSLFSPYFENNAGWQGTFGTVADSHVTVINPTFMTGPYTGDTPGAFLFDRVTSGAVIGGSFTAMGPTSVKFTSNAKNVSLIGVKIGPNKPTFDPEGGKSISQYPGLVNFEDPSTGNRVLSGLIHEANIQSVIAPPTSYLKMKGRVASGTGVPALIFDSDNLTTTGDLLASFRMNGTEIGRIERNGIARFNGLQLKSSAATPYVSSLSTSIGHLVLNNGTVGQGAHWYYGNNLNFGIDVAGGKLRIVKDLNETTGAVLGTIDTSGTWQFGTAGPMVMTGAFDPEGSGTATAPPGSLFLRMDPGVAGTTLYVKQSGSGDTGWVGK